MQKTSLAFMTVLALSLISCASPQQKKILSDYTPSFAGYFSEISVSIYPQYKPATLMFALSGSIWRQLYGREPDYSDINFTGTAKVSQSGELLKWVMDIKNYDVGSTKLSDNIPLLRCELLTDRYGDLKESQASSPAIERGRIVIKGGQAEYSRLIESMNNEVRHAMPFSVLPKGPIGSGSVLREAKIVELAEPLIEGIALLATEKDGIRKYFEDKYVQLKVRGKTHFKGRDVLLVDCDYVLNAEKVLSLEKAHLSIEGYSLIDIETFQTVFSEVLVTAKTQGQHVVVKDPTTTQKFLVVYSGEIF